MKVSTQSGYTQLELAGVIAISMLVLSVSAIGVREKLRTSRFDQTLSQAREIAYQLEANYLSVVTAVPNGAGDYTYTYRTEPNFITVAQLNTNWGTNFRTQTVYGTDYQIRARSGFIPEVRFLAPLTVAPNIIPANSQVTGTGANRTITVWAEERPVKRNKVYRYWRRAFMNENPRY